MNQANNDGETPLKRATEEGHIGITSSSFFFPPIRFEYFSRRAFWTNQIRAFKYRPIRFEYLSMRAFWTNQIRVDLRKQNYQEKVK